MTVAEIAESVEERKKKWLEDRRSAITGTDAAKILGLSKHGGPMEVWLSKTRKVVELEGDQSSPWLRWGRRFERPILDEYAERQGEPLSFADPHTLVRSPRVPFIGATLDAVRMRDGRAVDAKNVGHLSNEYGDDGSDRVPLYYAVQLFMQMLVTETDAADLAVLFNRFDFRVYTVPMDKEVMSGIVDQCTSFWLNHVQRDEPPPVDGSASYRAYLQEYFAQASETILDATPEQHAHAQALHTLRQQLKGIGSSATFEENALKAAIGEAKGIAGPGWRATWSTTKDSTKVDWEAVAREAYNAWAILYGQRVATFKDDLSDREVDNWDAFVARHSAAKPGYRRFLFDMKADE